MYAKQEAFVDCPARYTVVEASTKTGKTVACLIWLFERALTGKPGHNFWWIAPTYGVAGIAFRRLKTWLRESGLAPGIWQAMEADQAIGIGGRVIWFKGADKPDSLYGEDVYAAVVDEATRCKADSWHAVRSTLTATQGPVKIIGNVRGRKNWAYNLARKAESGEAGFGYFKLTAWDAVNGGVLDADEVRDAERTLPADAFRELYLAEPADDGGNPFGIDAIAKCERPELANGPATAWGIDLGKTCDYTVVCGLNADGDVCRLERWQSDWGQTRRRILDLTAGDAPVSVDSTGLGDPIVEELQRVRDRLYGYNFSPRSKQQLMEGLASAIQREELTFPAGWLRNELDAFEYEYTATGVRYCVGMETRILTADLRWVEASSLRVGDNLLAFDEFPAVGSKFRAWRTSVVEATGEITRPSFRVTLEDGASLIASQEHRWLVDTGPGGLQWRRTDELRAPHPWSKSKRFSPSRIVRVLTPWEEATTYEAGYLAATLDGEGYLGQTKRRDRVAGHSFRVGFAQRDNALAVHARQYMRAMGYEWSECVGERSVIGFGITGRQHQILRFLGQVRPRRLLEKFDGAKLGTMWRNAAPRVSGIESLGDQVVVALGTSTKTFIAEGLASHNSAPAGLHDDGVCALALAVHCRTSHRPLKPIGGRVFAPPPRR